MDKFELFVKVIVPIVACLMVYGIIVVARFKNTGWDLKGILMVLCLVLPGIGWIIAIIVRNVRNRRLKKAEATDQNISPITSSGNLFHYRLFLFIKEVTILMVSFLIGKAATWFYFYVTFAQLTSSLTADDSKYQEDSLLHRIVIERMHKDSMNQKRRDSITHRILDSIIQTRIDSLKMMRDYIVK